MSVQWTYKPNEKQETFFCPHCGGLRDTPYFVSGGPFGPFAFGQVAVVCLQCAKVLAKAYKMAVESEGRWVMDDSIVVVLDIELVVTPEQIEKGLMKCESLPADSGMVFDILTAWGCEGIGGFWMKDTSIPLSIAFVDSSGKIISVHDMEPFDETPVDPGRAYAYAIETNRGWFSKHGIVAGFAVSIGSSRAYFKEAVSDV